MSPIRYVLLRRLREVHSALRDADPDTVNVAEVAHRFGFAQFGRSLEPTARYLARPHRPRFKVRRERVSPPSDFFQFLHSRLRNRGFRVVPVGKPLLLQTAVLGDRAMIIKLAAVARAVPLTAIILGACVSQSAYDQLQAQNQQLQAQNQ